MAKNQANWNKRNREQKKRQARKEKEQRKLERKENSQKGKSLDDMLAYLDENGNLTSTPPETSRESGVDSR
ncbi:MAG TPA: hypothetical protein VEB63_06495 [Chitinophagaceae bacterium]|nr:hypothetical protein [Chitinophagaceae bacterium]